MQDESSQIDRDLTSAGLPKFKDEALDEWSNEQLVDGIRSDHQAVEAFLRQGLERARSAGLKLLALQRRLPYGVWTSYVQANLPCSVRAANNYMRIARAYPRLPDTVGSIEGALEFLASSRQQAALPAPVEALPPPATEYEAAVRRTAALVRQWYDLRLEQVRLLADLLDAADDVSVALAQLTEELGESRHWGYWLEEVERMIDGPDDELGREYLRLLKYKGNLLAA